jgi:hypothetical protein
MPKEVADVSLIGFDRYQGCSVFSRVDWMAYLEGPVADTYQEPDSGRLSEPTGVAKRSDTR